MELGLHISFSGVVTRSTRQDLREVARRLPADRLLLETDAPWGTPRGRSGPMRPAWLRDTAEVVAEARGISLPELIELERENASALFERLRLD
jgi:TatD DNase family protein